VKVHPIAALQTEYSLWSRDPENAGTRYPEQDDAFGECINHRKLSGADTLVRGAKSG
jgi:hypothetical protein